MAQVEIAEPPKEKFSKSKWKEKFLCGAVNIVISEAQEELECFSVTLREPRTLQVVHGDEAVRSTILKAVKAIWADGIVSINEETAEVYNIKLNGSPFWYSFSNEYALKVHCMVMLLIQHIEKSGYTLTLATDIAKQCELSTLFFCKKGKEFSEKKPQSLAAKLVQVTESAREKAGMSLAETVNTTTDSDESPGLLQDRLRLNKNENISKALLAITVSQSNQLMLANCSLGNKMALTQLITNTWHKGIKKEISMPSGYIIILNGEPWTHRKAAFPARSLLHQIVLLMCQKNWQLLTVARIKNHRDTMIFKYEDKDFAMMDTVHDIFLSLSISGKDKLRVIHCSDTSIINDLRAMIIELWKPGLQRDYARYGGWEFDLAEEPWWCESTEAIATRYFICDLLETLMMKGFNIHASIECHPFLIEKTTLTFKKCAPKRAKVVCISFDGADKVRVINGSESFVNAVRNVLRARVGAEGISKERVFLKSTEFSLDHRLWDGRYPSEASLGKSLCCHILQKMIHIGWRVVLSVDCTSEAKGTDVRHDIPNDVHSWYLVQNATTRGAFKKFKKGLKKKEEDPDEDED